MGGLVAAPDADGTQATMNFQTQGRAHKLIYSTTVWDRVLPHADTREAAIEAERAALGAVGGQVPALGRNVRRAVNNDPAARRATIYSDDYVIAEGQNHVWPFTLRLASTYGAANTVREVWVSFTHAQYGYVYYIKDGTKGHELQQPSEEFGNLFLGADFSALHAVDPARDIRTQALAMGDDRDVDDQTKIIAEGARWQAVATKAAAGNLRDDTRFYAARQANDDPWPADAADVPYVEFGQLWSKWGSPFQKAWNIPDDVFRARLHDTPHLRGPGGPMTLAQLQARAENHPV